MKAWKSSFALIVMLLSSNCSIVEAQQQYTQDDADQANLAMLVDKIFAQQDAAGAVTEISACVTPDTIQAFNVPFTTGTAIVAAGNSKQQLGDTAYGNEDWGTAVLRYNEAEARYTMADSDFLTAWLIALFCPNAFFHWFA